MGLSFPFCEMGIGGHAFGSVRGQTCEAPAQGLGESESQCEVTFPLTPIEQTRVWFSHLRLAGRSSSGFWWVLVCGFLHGGFLEEVGVKCVWEQGP